MSEPVEVCVDIDGDTLPVGRLYAQRRNTSESAMFVYHQAYLEHPQAYPIDPGLPLTTGSHHTSTNRRIFGAVTDTAPDRWGRRLLDRAEHARATRVGSTPRRLGEIDYVLGVRDQTRQGALRFRDHATGAFLAASDDGVPPLVDLPRLLDAADALDTTVGDTDPEGLALLVRAGSSLGGARPKAHVVDTDGRIAIAKFPQPSSDAWNVMAWEKVALDLAAAAGIEVAPSRLIDVADRSVLILDRFDRKVDRATRSSERVGYVSAMTMLESTDGDHRSYLDIADVIERASPSATEDLRQLWRRMVFFVLISNTDDHLRNHGFLRQAQGWRLAPAFDLNPDPSPADKHLTTSIDGTSTRASIAAALEVAAWFRLSTEAAHSIVAEVVDVVDGWRDTAERLGLSRTEITRIKPAFEHAARAEVSWRSGGSGR